MVDQRGGGVRVLHVDDDDAFLDLVSTHLEHATDRLELEPETDPRRALERIRADPPDCIVSDYEMPEMDGLDLLRTVRESHPDLPFVLFTGKGSEEIASEAISAGVTDYLQKGGGTEKFELLANRVENAVEAHRVEAAFDTEHEKLTVLFQNSPDAIVEYRVEAEEAVVEAVNPASSGRSASTARRPSVNPSTTSSFPRTDARVPASSTGGPARRAPSGRRCAGRPPTATGTSC